MNSMSPRSLALLASAMFAVPAFAQSAAPATTTDPSVHAITLPSDAAAPQPVRHKRAQRKTRAVAPHPVSADDVHPITSLPRPQGAEATVLPVDSSAHYVKPTHEAAAPVAQPAVLTAAPADEAVSSSSAAGAPPVPEGVKTPPAPPMPDPTPANVGPEALHVRVPPATAVQALPAGGVSHIRPFSAVGLQLKAGFGGAGADIAVPLAQHWNARVGGTFFQYSGTYTIDGINISGEVKFRSGNVSLDYYPFKGTFRVSPGVTFYNGNNIRASAQIPGGQTFTLNDVNYTSAVNDPVRGSAAMSFGTRQAPSVTMGWGNMIPRRGSRFSVPFEAGIQYIGDPKITMNLAGTACSAQGTVSGCGQLQSDPIAQDNLAKELKKVNDQIHPLAYYPILSIGVSWSLGAHNR